jgi:hypothetical protein
MDHQAECGQLIDQARRLYAQRNTTWNDSRRESFELATAALGYQSLALRTWNSIPHTTVRKTRWPFDEWLGSVGQPLRGERREMSRRLLNLRTE